MKSHFDTIVIGAGGMGSATAFALARRGQSVLVLEQFTLGHSFGSSHGHTRIIRKAYFEHPDYVPLLHRAFERWHDLEQRTGQHLLTVCGCLSLGTLQSELIRGVLASSSQHRLNVDYLDAASLRKEFPQFMMPPEQVGLLERGAGLLFVEECVRAHLEAARELSAVIQSEERVIGWTSTGDSVVVTTDLGEYHAARLVITAGPWLAGLIPEIGYPFTLMRQVQLWFNPTNPESFRRDRFPAFITDTPHGSFYGLPMLDQRGVKVARHYGADELGDPGEVDANVSPEDETTVREFLERHLPEADGEVRDAQTCIYTLTPDRHFVMDLHPEFANVSIAGGFSGHGFKFASVAGEIMADLVEHGRTELPVKMFNIARLLGNPPDAGGTE